MADSNFKRNGSSNTIDTDNNSFTIASSYGSVYWSWVAGEDFSQYQYLVLRVNEVKGNTVRLILKDKNNREYNHLVDLSNIDGPQELIVDLMAPLKTEDKSTQVDLEHITRITFWNYWDDGDGEESATVSIAEMFFEPYGGDTIHISNPVIQTLYTSDPAGLVYQDRLYLYTGHDEFGATYYDLNEWLVFSSADMVNWQAHGPVMDYTVHAWSTGSAWASQCVERNGKFYWYTCCDYRRTKTINTGVVVGDSPIGPFEDQLGKPLTTQYGDIDPTVLVDNDGKAYMYYGNNALRYILLNEDMISYDGEIHTVELTNEAFGGVKTDGVIDGIDCYEEGPWLMKRNGIYYLIYAAGGVPEHISYSISTSPTGPWEYKGIIMPSQGGSFTNHPSVVDFKGHTYLIYHNGALEGGGGFTRSVCVEEITINEDGSFPTINMTATGVEPIGTLNPYELQQAETMSWSYGVRLATDNGIYLDSIDNKDYVKVRQVDFQTGASSVIVNAKGINGGSINIFVDNPKGQPIAVIDINENTDWAEYKATIENTPTGIHNIYFVFNSISDNTTELLNFDSWQFVSTDDIKKNELYNSLKRDGVYDLMGRKISSKDALKKGVYIINGKKSIIN